MRIIRALLVLALSLKAQLGASTGPVDLGEGLTYLRISSLSESAPAQPSITPPGGALVLDLRYCSSKSADNAWSAVLARPAGSGPIFVLVSPSTPAEVAATLGNTPAAILTLGAPGTSPPPRVIVHTDAATDRRAYDAFASGTSLESLISGKIEKQRFDEATLVHEFKNGNATPEPPPTPDPTAPKPAAPGGTAPPPARLTDRVLQRAVHLHRAWLALRR
jgi:hypothetical protein